MSASSIWSLFRQSLSELIQSSGDDRFQQTVDQEIAILTLLEKQAHCRLDQAIALRDSAHQQLIDLKSEKNNLEQEIIGHLQSNKRRQLNFLAQRVVALNSRIDTIQVQWERAVQSVRTHEGEVEHFFNFIQCLKQQPECFQDLEQSKPAPVVTSALEIVEKLEDFSQNHMAPASESAAQVLKRLKSALPPLIQNTKPLSVRKTSSTKTSPKSKRRTGDRHD